MSTTPRSDDRPAGETASEAATPSSKAYEKPALTEYGPLAKITQGAAGSTGESGNFTMRMCL